MRFHLLLVSSRYIVFKYIKQWIHRWFLIAKEIYDFWHMTNKVIKSEQWWMLNEFTYLLFFLLLLNIIVIIIALTTKRKKKIGILPHHMTRPICQKKIPLNSLLLETEWDSLNRFNEFVSAIYSRNNLAFHLFSLLFLLIFCFNYK